MRHLVILYTANLEKETDMSALCRTLANTMLQVKDETGAQVYPTGGTRVFAYPAPHFAVADSKADYAFVYLNVRMAKGRSYATKKIAGEAIMASAKSHFESVFAQRHIGMTLQIDEGFEVFDAKHSNLHPLFNKSVI